MLAGASPHLSINPRTAHTSTRELPPTLGHTEMLPKSLNHFWLPSGWGQRWLHLSRVFTWHCCGVSDLPLPGVGGQAAARLCGEFGHFNSPLLPVETAVSGGLENLQSLLQGFPALGWLRSHSGGCSLPSRMEQGGFFSSTGNPQHVALMGKGTPRGMKVF